MRPRIIIPTVLAIAAAAVAVVLLSGGDGQEVAEASHVPGQPVVEVISPRNGSRQVNRAVVVKVEVRNFRMAPRHFGRAPQLGEGHIRFSLNRVPNCVAPEKLERAINSPLGSG